MSQASSSISCPSSDGTQFTASGAVFNIHCGRDYYGGDIGLVQTDTFAECLTACATTNGCVDVAYNGQNCYMKNQLTSSQQNNNVWGAVLASVEQALDNEVTCDNGKDNNVVYTAASGDSFVISCATDYYGGDLSSLWTNTFQDCIDACDKTSGCTSVSSHGNYCYLKNGQTSASSNSAVSAAKKLDASCKYYPSSGTDASGYTTYQSTFWSWNGLNYLGSVYPYSMQNAEEICDSTPGCSYFTYSPNYGYADLFQGPTTETPCQSPSSDFIAAVKY